MSDSRAFLGVGCGLMLAVSGLHLDRSLTRVGSYTSLVIVWPIGCPCSWRSKYAEARYH